MKLDYKKLLEIIFPPSEDELNLLQAPETLFIDITCQKYEGVTFLLPYHNKAVRSAIHLAKFHHNPLALNLLGLALSSFIDSISQDILIIPVPLSKQRLHERGYNQVTEIIKYSNRINPVLFSETILKRTRNRKPQASLSRQERLNNVNDVFQVNVDVKKSVSNKHLILLDDVTTTGATLKAARTTITRARLPYASLTCLALAH